MLWGHSSAPAGDAWTFAGANMFNWLIGGIDAHAKNYSVMIGSKGRVRLAPLYDVASAVPHVHPKRLRLANRIGGKYRTQDVRARHWKRFAADVNLPVEKVIDMGLLMADRLPDELCEITAKARTQGIDHPVMESGQPVVRPSQVLHPCPSRAGNVRGTCRVRTQAAGDRAIAGTSIRFQQFPPTP